MDFVREWCFCKLLTGLKDFRLLCPRFIPHVLPSALAGVIFHPAAAALVAAVNIFRNMGVVVCPGQSATPLTAAAFGNADDARPQTGPALKSTFAFRTSSTAMREKVRTGSASAHAASSNRSASASLLSRPFTRSASSTARCGAMPIRACRFKACCAAAAASAILA